MASRYLALVGLAVGLACGGSAPPEAHPSPEATHVTLAVESLMATRAGAVVESLAATSAGTVTLEEGDSLFLQRAIARYAAVMKIGLYARHRNVAARYGQMFAVDGKWRAEQRALRVLLSGAHLGGSVFIEGHSTERERVWDVLPQESVGDTLLADVIAHHDGTLRFVDSMLPTVGPSIAPIARALRTEREEERLALGSLLRRPRTAVERPQQ